MSFQLGIIGLGKIAQDQHLPVVEANPDFRIAAVVSSRQKHKVVPAFKTPAELFASGIKLDAVSLCMPPEPRFDIAQRCHQSWASCIDGEAANSDDGRSGSAARLAAERGRVLFSTWHSQYNAAVDEAKRLLAGKTVSKLFVNWKEDVRHWHPGQEWIWQPGGFGVFDPGINAFSIVTEITPQPIFVEACTLETPSNRATPIAAKIRFKPSWSGKADLAAELDWRQTGEQSWNISVSTDEGLHLELRKGGAELYVNGDLAIAEPAAEYEGIYEHFASLLKSGQSHVDVAPLQLVSDCFLVGRRMEVEAFL